MELSEKSSSVGGIIAAGENCLPWAALICSVGLHLGALAGLAAWGDGTRNVQAPIWGVTQAASAAGEFVEMELDADLGQHPEAADTAAATASPLEQSAREVAAESPPSSRVSEFVEESPATPTDRELEKAPPRKPAPPAHERPPAISTAAAKPRSSPKETLRGSTLHRGTADHVAKTSAGTAGNGGATASASRGPAYLNNTPPTYPPTARQAGQQGLVLLWVAINERGSVADLRLQRSSGFPELDAAALSAVRAWRFRPAVRSEVPVPAAIRVPVRFQLDQ